MFNRLLPTLAPALLLVAATLPAHAQDALPTQDFDVYVDLPTGFAFVKASAGWKFIRKLDAEQLKKLHPTTLTSLLEQQTPAAVASATLVPLRADRER